MITEGKTRRTARTIRAGAGRGARQEAQMMCLAERILAAVRLRTPNPNIN